MPSKKWTEKEIAVSLVDNHALIENMAKRLLKLKRVTSFEEGMRLCYRIVDRQTGAKSLKK